MNRSKGSSIKHSRYEVTRKWLIFWCLFIGIGAVAGSVGMFVAPDGSTLGMDALLPYFQVLPFAELVFQDFIFPGISLLIVNGLSNLTAAYFMLRRKPVGILLGGIFGVTLMLWICIQFYIFPMNFMSTIYFIFGLIQAATGYMAFVFYRQETFAAKEAENLAKEAAETTQQENQEYTSAGNLVVYFSRMGYTRHYALELAAKEHATVYEVKSLERTEGTLGFWWCGRYGMHRWEMPVEEIKIDLTQFDHVTICTPVWVFELSAPMRSFCKQASGKIRKVSYVLVHFQKSKYENVCREMDQLLGIRHEQATSICFRKGREIRRYKL